MALIAPLAVARAIAGRDWWIMAAVSVAFCASAVVFGAIPSWVCALFLVCWLGYVVWSMRGTHGTDEATDQATALMSVPVALLWISLGVLAETVAETVETVCGDCGCGDCGCGDCGHAPIID